MPAGPHEVGDQVEVVLEKRKWCCSSRVACATKSVCWVVLMRNIDRKGWSALCFCGSCVRQCLRPDALFSFRMPTEFVHGDHTTRFLFDFPYDHRIDRCGRSPPRAQKIFKAF